MYKDKNGLYRKQVTINGKRHVFNGKTQREVMVKIAEFQQKKSDLPFRQVAHEWWTDAESRLAYSTLRGYNHAFDVAVDYFGDYDCTEITPLMIQNYINTINKSKKTVSAYLLVLRLILTHACSKGLEYNPAQNVKAPKGTRTLRDFPDEEDIKLVNSNVDKPFGLIAYATLWTGLRRGELCGLRWEDVDFEKKVIHVRRSVYWSLDNKPHIKEPKSASGVREVPLMDALADKLRPLKSASEDYVFSGKQPFKQYEIQTAMTKYRNETGLKCTLHGLRHGFASILFGAGLPLTEVSYVLGHAQKSTTLEIYIHMMNDDKVAHARDALNKLN